MAHQVSCHRPSPAISWPSSRPCRSAHRPCRALCHALCRSAPARAATRRIAGLLGCSAASYRNTTPCHRPLPVTIQNLYRDPSPCRAHIARRVARSAARVTAPAPYRGSLLRRIATLAGCITTQSRPLSHDTKFCIATLH